MSDNSVYYEERLKILQKIHEIRDIITKPSTKPNVSGSMDTIYKCLRDGYLSEVNDYKDICLMICLDHILQIDKKYGLSDNVMLKGICEDLLSYTMINGVKEGKSKFTKRLGEGLSA